jgi:hypothetical protein
VVRWEDVEFDARDPTVSARKEMEAMLAADAPY